MRGIYREKNLEGVETIILREGLPQPVLEESHVVIQVKVCGLSLLDESVLSELFRKNPLLHYPVGHEISGIVTQVGTEVSSLQCGDEVVGILPLDTPYPGCGQFCSCNEYDVIKKPNQVSFVDAAGAVGDSVKAYTALHYLGRLCSGDTLLIIDGASSFGNIAIQLAQQWGAKVLATASSSQERKLLEDKFPKLAQVIDLSEKHNLLITTVMEETGGIGVDCVIDNGVNIFNAVDDENKRVTENYVMPSKHDLIACLALGSRWITTQFDLQLDPPDSQLLYMKCASVCFLFEHGWTLSSAQQGRYQHILKDVMLKIENNRLRPSIAKIIPFTSAVDELNKFSKRKMEKIVVEL